MTNTNLLGLFVSCEENEVLWIWLQSKSVSSWPMNGRNKLVCHMTFGRKGLPDTNTLLIGPICKIRRKWSAVNMTPKTIFKASVSLGHRNGPNKLECHMTFGWKGLPVTNTPLIGPICKLRRKLRVVNLTQKTVFTQHQFLSDLWIVPISWSIALH